MNKKRFFALLLGLCLLAGTGAAAAEVESDSVYCFSTQDFSPEAEQLRGICITSLPTEGTVYLGQRVLRAGDILTSQQIDQMTFAPLRSEQDLQVQVSYLPIYDDRVEQNTVMTISVWGKEDRAPEAQDSTLETYKNLPNEGTLKVADPEGQALTYTLVRAPKRGQVEIREDGTFLYTPKKNKVGVDSFTYTATDPAGNVSRTATVTVQILKPTDARQYTDTVGEDCRFAAEWMRNTGLFIGESVAGEQCFFPDKEVSRGQFLTMLLKTLEIPGEDAADTNAPAWLQPYLAAAERAGLTANLADVQTWDWEQSITGAEAAVMVQNALDLQEPEVSADAEQTPDLTETCLAVMAQNGIELSADGALTRAQVAQMLYKVSDLSVDAPGMAVFRMN